MEEDDVVQELPDTVSDVSPGDTMSTNPDDRVYHPRVDEKHHYSLYGRIATVKTRILGDLFAK